MVMVKSGEEPKQVRLMKGQVTSLPLPCSLRFGNINKMKLESYRLFGLRMQNSSKTMSLTFFYVRQPTT